MISRAASMAGAAALLLAGAACGYQPVPPSECQSTAVTKVGRLLVLEADPTESTIRAVLPSAASPNAGQPYDVRWTVDARKAGDQIRIQAVREGAGQVYRGTFSGAASGGISEFQTSLVFPAAGCWDADVFTGTALGSLTFKVA